MKTKLLILFLVFSIYCFSQQKYKKINISRNYEAGSEIYRNRMRELILEIKKNTSRDRLLITQNGNELYFYNGELNKDFINVTDGTTQESLYYGAEFKLTNPMSKKQKEQLLNWLIPVRKYGKPVFVINYGVGEKVRQDLLKSLNKQNL